MKPSPLNEGERWRNQAMADLQTVEALIAAKRYDTACFIAQQSAEKAIKGFLYARGEEMVLGHSVMKLLDLAGEYETGFRDLKSEVKNLDQYYIEARYPNGLPDSYPAEFYEAKDAGWAHSAARRVLETVETHWPG